jgi:hypothetical protein
MLQAFEILDSNVFESMNSLKELLTGYKVKILLSSYDEKYKKISFSNIGTINVSKSITKLIKKFSENHQVVHSLLVNKPNNITKSWNFILILVPFHKITDQILSAFIDKAIAVQRVYLNSLVNLDIINRIKNLNPVKTGPDKVSVKIAASQIGKYLHVVIFINNYIHEIVRYTLVKIKDNTDEIIFKIKTVSNTLLASEIITKEANFQYILLHDNTNIERLLLEESKDYDEFVHEKLLVSKNIEDIKSTVIWTVLKLRTIHTKLIHFSKLSRLYNLSFLFNKLIIGLSVTVVIFFIYTMVMIHKLSLNLEILGKKELKYTQKLLEEEREQDKKIENLNANSRIIYSNLKNNRYPLELLNIIKKVIEYNLTITNIEYLQKEDEKKLILDIYIPRELSSRNKVLDKITNFFQYLKLNLPAHNELRFYRDTPHEEHREIIPVQIVIIDKKT